ncbi:MAG: DUF222 domain-containing protein [Marmoricola sp.]|nr:DUF222 domain-containing protein [Marmoricola sp.]
MSVLVDREVEDLDDAFASVDSAIDRLMAAAEGDLSSAECERALTCLERQGRRLSAVRMRVLAAAGRRRAAQEAGFASTEGWVAQRTRTPRGAAARQVALAGELTSGYAATAAALDEGLLSPAHAAVIVGAAHQLPPGLGPEQRRVVEQTLVADARRLDPDQLRRRARRVLETVEPDRAVVDAHENELVASQEEAARQKCALSLHDNGDGTTSGRFTVPTLGASMLRKVVDAMSAPRRMRLSVDQLGSAQEPVTFDWRKRRGLAFAELLEHLPTDHLHSKTAATVVVTVEHSALVEALKVAGLDTGDSISASQARRLACNAGLIPAVLGGRSVPLDLGREARLFSEAQRVAAGLSHDSCAASGCDRPFAWCELHHRHGWAAGGRTDLHNAVPFCHWHHSRIHDQSFMHEYLPDGTIRFRRRP